MEHGAVMNEESVAAIVPELDGSQQLALQRFCQGSNLALFGRAGSGKSEMLRRMIAVAHGKWGADAVAVAALAGSASSLIGGQTLHSLFGMDTRPLSREMWLRDVLRRPHVCARLNNIRVLFVDEVCSIPSSLLDRFGYVMRRIAAPHMQHVPFGGCQVVAVGDPLQAAPVKVTDTSVDRMVFDCCMWRTTFEGHHGVVSCLTGCHRQSGDMEFQKLLDRVRWGRAGDATINRINDTWETRFTCTVTKLRIRKVAVQEINQMKLSAINTPEHTFEATDVFLTDDPRAQKQAAATLRGCVDLVVTLKQSAVVILTRKVQDVVPGSRGVVREVITRELVIDDRVCQVKGVMCDFGSRVVEVSIARFPAYNSAGVEVAYCDQVPLLLGWAITVHRAQGLTLDAVEIDFRLDTWSTCGLVYTALSRARSLSALRVRGLRRDLIRVSRLALAYYESCLRESGVAPEDDGRPSIEA